ncbi:17413_t:CDS:2, partial [Dentiscutata heterogama]
PDAKKIDKKSNIECLIEQERSQSDYGIEELKYKKVYIFLLVKEEISQKSNKEKICIDIDLAETSKSKHVAVSIYTEMADMKMITEKRLTPEKSQAQATTADKALQEGCQITVARDFC